MTTYKNCPGIYDIASTKIDANINQKNLNNCWVTTGLWKSSIKRQKHF